MDGPTEEKLGIIDKEGTDDGDSDVPVGLSEAVRDVFEEGSGVGTAESVGFDVLKISEQNPQDLMHPLPTTFVPVSPSLFKQ